jgi:heme/copper-type cytochrome/quinol oxidase subunit 2
VRAFVALCKLTTSTESDYEDVIEEPSPDNSGDPLMMIIVFVIVGAILLVIVMALVCSLVFRSRREKNFRRGTVLELEVRNLTSF